MVDYATPVRTTFEMQRQSIAQGQRALQQSVDFQRNFASAFVDGLSSQQEAQARTVELSQQTVHNALDAIDASVPGVSQQVADIRENVDEQYDALLDSHAEAFETLEAEFSEGADAYDQMLGEYLDAVDEQLALLVEAHEELESQSVEAVEQLAAQFEDLQRQVETVQEQAAEAVDA